MNILTFPKKIPAPSVGLFFSLQVLDALTTMIGLRAGASESNIFVSRVMQWGPLTGLAISKLFALMVLVTAFRLGRQRVIVAVNLVSAAVVTGNLLVISRFLFARVIH